MFNPNQYTFDEIVKLASVGEQALIKIAGIDENLVGGNVQEFYAKSNSDGKQVDNQPVLQKIKDAITKGWESTKSGAKAAWNNPYGKAAVIGGGSLAGLYALIKSLSSKKKKKEYK